MNRQDWLPRLSGTDHNVHPSSLVFSATYDVWELAVDLLRFVAMRQHAWIIIAALTGCAAPAEEAGELVGPEFQIDDDDKADTTRPAMTLSDPELLGIFAPMTDGQDCRDGRDFCAENAEIKQLNARPTLFLGSDRTQLSLVQSGQIVAFTESFDEECDDPGCSNLQAVYGIVYYKMIGADWKPAVRVTTVVDYPYPESDEDLSGPQTERAYLVRE